MFCKNTLISIFKNRKQKTIFGYQMCFLYFLFKNILFSIFKNRKPETVFGYQMCFLYFLSRRIENFCKKKFPNIPLVLQIWDLFIPFNQLIYISSSFKKIFRQKKKHFYLISFLVVNVVNLIIHLPKTYNHVIY